MSAVTKGCAACGEPFEFEAVGRFAEQLARLRTHCPTCDRARAEQWKAEDEQQAASEAAGVHHRRLRASGLPERLWGAGQQMAWPADAVDAARRFATGEIRGLLLTGPVGTGKTTLAGQAFARRLSRRTGYWRSTPALLAHLGSGMGSRERDEALSVLAGRSMLGLDDLDKVRTSEYAAEQMFLAIDNAYAYSLPLVVTANLSLAEIAGRFDGAMGEAIADRLREHCVWVQIGGQSRREEAA